VNVRWLRWAGPAAAVAVAVTAGVLGQRDTDTDTGSDKSAGQERSAADEPPLEVASDAPRYATLDDLAAAADLVVTGEVEGIDRGRTFGQPGGAAIVSRLVTLRVDDVLTGTMPSEASNVLVEEEGWLDDGRPVAVDGAAPTEVGDRGIWFLVDVHDPEMPVYTVVNAEGRYLFGDGSDGDDGGGASLVGADGDDPLIAEIESLTPAALTDRIEQLDKPSG
jgi:hypothetical protein